MNDSGAASVDFDSATVSRFLAELAAKQPVPGGGAAAGVVVATAASLASMVVAYSVGRRSLTEHEGHLKASAAELDRLRIAATEAAAADARAYAGLQALWGLERDDPARRDAWSGAVEAAIAAPRSIMALAEGVLEIAESLEDRSNRMLKSDLAIAAVLADAGFRSAAANVRINLPLLEDPARAANETAALAESMHAMRVRADRLELACR